MLTSSSAFGYGSGFLVLAVAWLTVGAVAARAARAKPIHSLRYE